jgi:coupling of ubiquitin conjugation to ER degradation protein 1
MTVLGTFPHIPAEAIRYDLARTGSVELTCENILRDGELPPVCVLAMHVAWG